MRVVRGDYGNTKRIGSSERSQLHYARRAARRKSRSDIGLRTANETPMRFVRQDLSHDAYMQIGETTTDQCASCGFVGITMQLCNLEKE